MEKNKFLVKESRQKDAGRGKVRIHITAMRDLNIKENDIIGIQGKSKTVARVLTDSIYRKEKTISMDGLIRKNAGASLNEYVLIKKVDVQDAQRIILAPIDMKLNVDIDFVNFVKNRLFDEPLLENSSLFVVILGSAIPFKIVRTEPSNVPVCITVNTAVKVLNEPVHVIQSEFNKTINIKNLLRMNWLENMVILTKATKTIFSIPDTDISNESEIKVINAAKKIALEEFENIRA